VLVAVLGFSTAVSAIVLVHSMAPKLKDAALLGDVASHLNLWRVTVNLVGPSRMTKAEATADLTAMRSLPRDQIPAFLQQLREAATIDSGSVSGSQRAAPGTATQQTTCSDFARGAQQAALGSVFQQTAYPDVFSGSPAYLPKHILVLEPSGTPACKKGRSAEENSVGPADAARPSSSVEALQTPQCKRLRLAEGGACGPSVSPTIAERLARSCRKSPRSMASPSVLEAPTPRAPSAEQLAREAEADEVRRLCSSAQPAVVKVFEYVRQKMLCHNTEDCLPNPGSFAHRSAYDQLAYVRAKHEKSQLRDDDYALLARTPQVLGPTVYGALEIREGGWHWSFVPAGVDVRSEPFASEAAAREDLRELQILLFPWWLHADNKQRAARLRQLLQRRDQNRALSILTQEPVLTLARRCLRLGSVRGLGPC